LKHRVKILLPGFPGKADLSYLGWSTVSLVEVGDKRILFDTGGQGARTQLTAALGAHGLVPADIDMVFLSHLHYDHCGNCALFPKAVFCLTEREFIWAQQCTSDPFLSKLEAEHLKHCKVQLVEDGQEVVPGVTALLSPGHTPGSASLVVNDGGERWYLVGDAVKNRAELTTGTVDLSLDREASANTIARFQKLKGVLVPGHDALIRSDGRSFVPVGHPSVEIAFPPGLKVNPTYLAGGHTGILRITLD
jgi:glyoxylase-like metal-dependent hydrolase (beta-lactamase superfamily II)